MFLQLMFETDEVGFFAFGMTDGEALMWGFFSLAVLVTFIVMLVRRPGEIKKEKFEKRDW